ncbi:type IV pilus biogenesis protein, putative [Pseudoalteromonas luteoviolacea B = ATCC 29581]|nr:type IV pilus biogenesis protein, putative [Pseudoalteromonas luteoviolacea B = ATCC 29581]
MSKKKAAGVTFFELVTTLAIITIIVVFTLPNLLHFHSRFTMQIEMQTYHRALAFARHYAINHITQVTTCALINLRCDKTSWGDTLTVFVDKDGDGTLDRDEKILHQREAIDKRAKLTYPRRAITFRPDGTPKGLHNGTFRYCITLPSGQRAGIKLSLNHSGRTKLSDHQKCDDAI